MFRFTIRDVLWVVLAVALALSWQLDRRTSDKRLEAMQEERDKLFVDASTWKFRAKHFETQWLYASSLIRPPPKPDEEDQ